MGLLALLVPIAISLFIYHNQGKKSTRNLGSIDKNARQTQKRETGVNLLRTGIT